MNLLYHIGKFIEYLLRVRVTKGVGPPPYSQRHARRRRRKGLQTSRVDLRYTGQMLRDLHLEHRIQVAYIGFSQPFSVAKAKANDGRRPWFGLTDAEADEVLDELDQQVGARL